MSGHLQHLLPSALDLSQMVVEHGSTRKSSERTLQTGEDTLLDVMIDRACGSSCDTPQTLSGISLLCRMVPIKDRCFVLESEQVNAVKLEQKIATLQEKADDSRSHIIRWQTSGTITPE